MADFSPITAHSIVKQYNKPNYLGARLKVDSQLNLVQWKKELLLDRQAFPSSLMFFKGP